MKAHHFPSIGVVLQMISTIVLIGLGFLITWKVITSMKDRREFARFEKERMMAKWDAVNTIFRNIKFILVKEKLINSRDEIMLKII